jgi:serine/threonine protein kinase
MVDESISYLAQSRTFEIATNTGELRELETFFAATPLFDITNTTVDGKYQILKLLGQGGMGAVYRARHLGLDKDIAFKTVRSSKASAQAIERFNIEVRAVAKLSSANIVRVYDSGITEKNQPYYTMELLLGETLEDKLKQCGSLSLAEALEIFAEMAEGLRLAHNQNIIHRDLKPANIFLSAQPNNQTIAKVVDFGIAKLADTSRSSQFLTEVGTVFGSPLYMSPEQSKGEKVDQRSDIYSFGCAFYEALVGQAPLVGHHALETIIMHQTKIPARLSSVAREKKFPLLLETFVARLLHKSPEHRPQSFDEVLAAFGRIEAAARAESLPTQRLEEEDSLTSTNPVASKTVLIYLSTFLCLTLLLVGGIWAAVQTQQKRPVKSDLKIKSDFSRSKDNVADLLDVKPALFASPPVKIEAGETEYENINRSFSLQDIETISRSSITALKLRRCKVDNASLGKLSRLHLNKLGLQHGNLDDSGVAQLAGCKELRVLEIEGDNITDAACRSLAKMTTLIELDLNQTHIDDQGLIALAALPNLQTLKLSQTKVTASGVAGLCLRSKTLKAVEVAICPDLSEPDAKKLQARFPLVEFRTVLSAH